MEAVKMKSYCPSDLPPEEVIDLFFRNYSRETMWVNSFYLFKCWTTNSCGLKENLPDQEIALFLDQLIEYYSISQVTAAVLRDHLGKMILRINKNYFPVVAAICAIYYGTLKG